MPYSGLMGFLYNIMNWIMRLAYVNILWIFFTMVGMIVFGFVPATSAMFAVTREWLRGRTDAPVFKTFWRSYKKGFFKANMIGLILIAIAYVLYIDLMYIRTLNDLLATILIAVLITLSIGYVILSLYIFPVFVHYKLSIFKYLKVAFMIGLASPLSTILMVAGIAIVYFLIKLVPGIIPFFSGSLLSVAIMWPANMAIRKVDKNAKRSIG